MEIITHTRKKLYASIGMMFLSVCAYGGFWWYLASLEQVLDETLRTIKEQQSINEQFNTLSEIITNSTEERDALQKTVIVGEAGVVEFLSEIDLLAAHLGIKLETSALNVTGEEAAAFKQLNLNVTVTGERRAVEQFITALEIMPYAKQITALRVAELVSSNASATAATIGLKVSMQ